MNEHSIVRGGGALSAWTLGSLLWGASAVALPTFVSTDLRLPNPDQPYVMTSERVDYGGASYFSVYNFDFQVADPDQLAFPVQNMDGSVAFDSTFDVTYRMDVSLGLGPVFTISGPGTARVEGLAPPNGGGDVFEFDTELVALDLEWESPLFDVYSFRESPTLASTGVTRVEGACYSVCPPIVLSVQVSSFFDVFTELTLNDQTWIPASAAIHVEQAPEPTSASLAAVVLLLGFAWRPARQANAGP